MKTIKEALEKIKEKGKSETKERRRRLEKDKYLKKKQGIDNFVHGEKFRMNFDETFGMLYCDLKIIWMGLHGNKRC